jgi:hypothetical protein
VALLKLGLKDDFSLDFELLVHHARAPVLWEERVAQAD